MVTPRTLVLGRAGWLLAALLAVFAVVAPSSILAEDGATGVVIQSKAIAGNVTLAGDVTGTGAATTVAKVNGVALGTTSATTGKVLASTGTTIASVTLAKDATIDGSGNLTLANNATARGDLGAAASGANGDITSLTNLTTALPVTEGGNGVATAALGDLRYGSAANTLAALAGSTTSLRKMLTQKGTGSVSAAPSWMPVVIGADCSAHAVSSGTAETVLKTFSFTAADIPIVANSLITIHTLWSNNNNANSKTMRVRIGAAGAGVAGFQVKILSNTTNIQVGIDVPLFVRATNSEICFATGFGNHEGQSSSSLINPAIDLSANWEITLTGQTATSGDTVQLEAAVVDVMIP